MPRVIGQPKPEMPAADNLEVLELKANLNSEQREYLEVLKAKMKKTLAGKTKQELAKAGDLVSLKKYKAILEEILEFLKTKEVRQSELEKKLDLKKQYDEQFKILKETGVIKKLKDGQWGMKDILGREQPIPSYYQIRVRLNAKAEMMDKKNQQGLTKLLLVPIGMKLSEITEKAGELIVKKHGEGNLLATDGTKLELKMEDDQPRPIYVDDIYQDADVKGDLVYGVKKFDKDNHGGRTKKELIKKTGGWQVMFIEDMPDLPKKGAGQEIEGRKQLEVGQSPEEYLAKIQTEEQYANEQFTTPEAQLIYFMEYLQRNNQVIDDWDGKGRGCWNAGAYFKSGRVPFGRWGREVRQFRLFCNDPDGHNDNYAVRSAVGV